MELTRDVLELCLFRGWGVVQLLLAPTSLGEGKLQAGVVGLKTSTRGVSQELLVLPKKRIPFRNLLLILIS